MYGRVIALSDSSEDYDAIAPPESAMGPEIPETKDKGIRKKLRKKLKKKVAEVHSRILPK